MKFSIQIVVCLSLLVAVNAAEPAEHDHALSNVVALTTSYINTLVDEARTNHPALRAARFRADAASFNADAVRRWEDPMFTFGGVTASRGLREFEEGNLLYELDQKLPLFGKQQLARRVAAAGADVQQAEVTNRFQLLRRDLVKALMSTALAEQVAEAGEQDLVWLRTLVATSEAKHRAGQAMLAEVLALQNELAKRAEQVRTDRAHLAHDRLTLNRLLNRELHAPWPQLQLPPPAPAVPYDDWLVGVALRNEPKLRVLHQEIRAAEARAEWTRRQRWPDLTLGVEGRQYSGDGGFREGTFKLGMTVPWGNRGRYQSDLRREEAQVRAAQLDRAEYALAVREEIHHLTVTIDAARREALLYRDEIAPRAGQALASAQSAWESGRGQLRDVLDARRMVVEARLAQARAVAEQYQLLGELILCCGLGDLEAVETISHRAAPAAVPANQP